MGNSRELSISQLAAQFGLNPKTIRYYESINLLPKPQRQPNGYRRYTVEDQGRLRFILQAKHLGFNLKEIAELLVIRRQVEQPCISGQRLLEKKLCAIDEQIHALTEFRRRIDALRRESETTQLSPSCICGIIEHHTLPSHPCC